MNYLAHAYLSFERPGILVGNMISDFIKGRAKFDYPEAIQEGINLHRAIDDFTDFHPVTREAKVFFRPQYRLYSGAFVDIVYDHFLANDKLQFDSEKDLFDFSFRTYTMLRKYQQHFPYPFSRMFPFMESQNWLYHYREPEGISRSFEGMTRRAKYLDESKIAFGIFLENYAALKDCYERFFPELKRFVQSVS
ncbi:MAG: ACP phosphodiesterase [Chitinophagaceae bacterium]